MALSSSAVSATPPPEPGAARPSSIAYVTTTFPTFAWFVESEVLRLREQGHRVRVFTLRRVGEPVHREHVALASLSTAVGSPFSWKSWVALVGWSFRRPRILVGDALRMLWASRGSAYAIAGHLGYLPAAARVASLVEREGIDHVHGAWAHFPASVAYLVSRLTGRRFSMAAHAGADLYRTRAFLPEKLKAAEFVTVCVRANHEMLQDLAGREANLRLVYHGADLERFDGERRTRRATPLIVGGGRLSPEKGFDLAIRSLAELDRRGIKATLALFGEGPDRSNLEGLARRLGVSDRVELHGRIAQPELVELLRQAWVFVAPCRVLPNGRRDGIPNVIVEAMAMGLPCIGTRVGGIAEAIVPGETGELCDAEDLAALTAALENLLRRPEELDRVGGNARARARQYFDARRNFGELLSLFRARSSETLALVSCVGVPLG
jgi:glycosyltransferase involved in cell wall biosynthesis